MEAPDAGGVEFGRVDCAAERILIIANGPSLRTLRLAAVGQLRARGVSVLAVNATLPYLPDAHFWFTLDPSRRLVRMASIARPGCRYFMAVPDDYGRPDARVTYHRIRPLKSPTYLRRMTGPLAYSAALGLSEEPGGIHTGNSAYGALGLAYHMRPRRIAFLGLDGTQAGYGFGPGSPRGSLAHLPALFASALGQLTGRAIEVINGNPASLVDCFPRVEPADALQWIAD